MADGWRAVIGCWIWVEGVSNMLGILRTRSHLHTAQVAGSSAWRFLSKRLTPWLQTSPTWKAKATNAAANCCKKWTRDLRDMAQSLKCKQCEDVWRCLHRPNQCPRSKSSIENLLEPLNITKETQCTVDSERRSYPCDPLSSSLVRCQALVKSTSQSLLHDFVNEENAKVSGNTLPGPHTRSQQAGKPCCWSSQCTMPVHAPQRMKDSAAQLCNKLPWAWACAVYPENLPKRSLHANSCKSKWPDWLYENSSETRRRNQESINSVCHLNLDAEVHVWK